MRIAGRTFMGIAAAALLIGSAVAQETVRSHGWVTHGELKYPADFKHFDYVNPDAPKGGSVVMGASGTFDTVHPFIAKGAHGVGRLASPGAVRGFMLYDTLLAPDFGTQKGYYGLIAEWVEVDSDANGVFTAARFKLREAARFHDGEPIRADDVVWTFNTLVTDGAPQYRLYYANVAEVVALEDTLVEFRFTPGENRELPLILGQLPILPTHYWLGEDFTKTTLEPPLGSGPYRIAEVDPGQSITLERVEDYWAADLPPMVGHYNFGEIRYDYYRDRVVQLEAFKKGAIDIRAENSAKNWATAYDTDDVREGRILKREFTHERGTGIQAFVMNQRRPLFADPAVRESMTYLWDFEWVNRNIMHDAYVRTDSFFENSELASSGLPSALELEVLEPLRGRIPDAVFTTQYAPPSTDGSGNNRQQLGKAVEILRAAGWSVRDRVLTHAETGAVFEFEILLASEQLTPHVQSLVRNVERLGGSVGVRVLDAAQYFNRLNTYDFDVVVSGWPASNSPGNEQREFWGSAAAANDGGRNISGVADPALDELIEQLIASPDRETLVARTRALDRVLLWSHLVIPMYHSSSDRYAYWNRFGFPETTPIYGTSTLFWWVDPTLDAALGDR